MFSSWVWGYPRKRKVSPQSYKTQQKAWKSQNPLMWCCFNIADSRSGLITLTAYLSGKSKGVRNNKEKVINSTPSECFMCPVWQRNQGLFHPVLISRHIEYMAWEFKPFHSTTGCFHFLAAVGTAYNQRAEGHPATEARTTSACRIISARPAWLCFPEEYSHC